jgi:outer membrane protein assembly factor BamB
MRRFASILLLSMIVSSVVTQAPRVHARPTNPGEQLWVHLYNGPGNNDSAHALGVSPDGSTVFVTGSSVDGSTGFSDYATVAYDASTGAGLWVRRYNGPANENDAAYALTVSPDGSKVFVTGSSAKSLRNTDYATVAYDASTGAGLWVRRYSRPANENDVAYALTVSPDGSKVFVTGSSVGRSFDYATVAYDASTGAGLWVRRYSGPANGTDYPIALGVSPDGSKVFVTGSSYGGPKPGNNYATLAYDASTGAGLWVRRYNGPANSEDFATALGVSPDGSMVFVTGDSGPLGAMDYATVAYDASTGTGLWVRRYDGAGSGGAATALGVSPDGSKVFVTGSSYGGPKPGNDYATVAYDASTGAGLWVRRYNGPANENDAAYALTVSPDGSKVFVTGDSGPVLAEDYATVAYDASTGQRLWVRRYNGPGNGRDLATALGVSSDGSAVFVTGTTVGSKGFYEYATVAYSTT